MKQYNTYVFENEISWQDVPEEKLGCFLWDSAAEYNVYFKMCFLKGQGIALQMRCDETELRAEGKIRDDRVWEDSCMEMFICPFENRDEYVNFEINCEGVYLSQYGKSRENRVFIKELTDVEADVSTVITDKGWSLELFVPCKLISEVYKQEFMADNCIIKGNFTKCGDLTKYPHYISYSKLAGLDKGFHNPEYFSKIIVNERN